MTSRPRLTSHPLSFGGLTGVCCRTHKLEKEKSVAFAKETGTGLPFCGVGGFTHTIPQQAYGPSANARPEPQDEAVSFDAAIAAALSGDGTPRPKAGRQFGSRRELLARSVTVDGETGEEESKAEGDWRLVHDALPASSPMRWSSASSRTGRRRPWDTGVELSDVARIKREVLSLQREGIATAPGKQAQQPATARARLQTAPARPPSTPSTPRRLTGERHRHVAPFNKNELPTKEDSFKKATRNFIDSEREERRSRHSSRGSERSPQPPSRPRPATSSGPLAPLAASTSLSARPATVGAPQAVQAEESLQSVSSLQSSGLSDIGSSVFSMAAFESEPAAPSPIAIPRRQLEQVRC